MRSRGSRRAASNAVKRVASGGAKRNEARGAKAAKGGPPKRHSVYVVYLRNPKGDGKAGYYVGMTGLTPEQRLANHLSGIKAARIVTKYGVRLVPTLYEHLNPLTYQDALRLEGELANSLRKRGFQVFGGH
jgi:predicted GIY-YIG superfamily endonuclease